MDIDPLFQDDDDIEVVESNSGSADHVSVRSGGLSSAATSYHPSSSATFNRTSQQQQSSASGYRSYASTLLDDLVGLPPELTDGVDTNSADVEIELSAQEVSNAYKSSSRLVNCLEFV